MKDSITLLDGYGLIYRTYFAFMKAPLLNKDGKNVSVVFGFFNSIFKFIKKHEPDRFAVVLDSKVPTFRHQMYPQYKANREKAPDDLHNQIPLVEQLLEKLEIPTFKQDGMEADDIIATIARKCSINKTRCHIITGDKDLLQLVDDYVSILKPDKGTYLNIGKEEVVEKWGVPPNQILELLSLIGDSADNIPGVAGIGPKTALKLLLKHPTLEEIFENKNDNTPAIAKKLEEGEENGYLSRKLVRLKEDLDFSLDMIPETNLNRNAADAIFIKENIPSLAINKTVSENLEEEKSTLDKNNIKIVTTLEEVKNLLKKASDKKIVAFDIETDNIDAMLATPVGFSLCFNSNEAWYIPLIAENKIILDSEEIKEKLSLFFSTKDLKIVGHNFKYDYKVLTRWGIKQPAPWFDTMIASWLLESDLNNFSMDFLAERYLNYTTIHFKDIVPKGELFQSIKLDIAGNYAAEDALITFKLYEIFHDLLLKKELSSLFFSMEMPLLEILANIELEGIKLDRKLLSFYSKKLGKQLEDIKQIIFAECGKEFNLNSPKQLQEVLFIERGLTPTKKTKTGFSTDTSVLHQLSAFDPIPKMILRHRSLAKLKSTYTDSLSELVNPNTLRLHTKLMQTRTATGRLSSREPNLQNIPIKDEEGRMIRRAFKAEDGKLFLSADYSQIELAVLASLSRDEALCNSFHTGVDIHRQTACLIFDENEENITQQQRRAAKTINFGVMYGMSSFGLSKELDISIKKAADFIKSYFNKYKGIKSFIDATIKSAEENGYVKSEAGHIRNIPTINSRNKTEKMAAQRIAVNTPIQGTAADIVKRAMISVTKRLISENLKSKLVLQIHDELLLEIPKEELNSVTKLVKEEMEKATNLSVPVTITIESGKSWGDFH